MNPKQYLDKISKPYEKKLNSMKDKHVVVGLVENKSTAIYENGLSIVEIGVAHEYGTARIPQRSFLRVPFQIKRDELNKTIDTQYKEVFKPKGNVNKSLNYIGITARNISVAAFNDGGYGTWKELSPYTIEQKGSSTILVDTGTLRNSITWQVRGN